MNACCWVQDTNLGLLDQCVKMWSRQKIKALTDTYLRRSLVDIAKVSGLENAAVAEANILLMVIPFAFVSDFLEYLVLKISC